MIDTQAALAAVLDRARQAGHIALDTEFFWERTYYPRLGLIQLALDEADVHLIDVLKLSDLSALGKLIADPNVEKILHDAQQDLTILLREAGAYPVNVFDTQTAGGFVGLGATASLASLLEATVGVHLPKTQTRTNWLRRPLTDEQVAYALDDVRYLPKAARELKRRAREKGHLGWMEDEMGAYDDPGQYDDRDAGEELWRISGSGRVRGRNLAVLQELAIWREEEAKRLDLPRTHVVKDKALVEAAQRLPERERDFSRLRSRIDRRHLRGMLDAIQKGLAIPEEAYPSRHRPPHVDDVSGARIDFALAYMKGKGLAEGIDPQLVANRADVTAVVLDGADAAPEDHPLLLGWRGDFLGHELLDLLDGRYVVRLSPDTGLPRVE